ncbi:DNA polymerase alpha accessory factor Mcl1 [Entomophthora muscae]|uniref:DNA polymerase alpha accessory factor Mcl1 n=1 Tax=Entomophthora muscae TaxID=34485 RepID=A0ACC2RH28_9FUNG|nr:DNA polymerase alpha accessory factor Mcl1 [Entomophthora muscae]
MGTKAPQIHYAHGEGQTVLAFSKDGKKIFTGGSDSLIRDFHTSFELRGKDRKTLTKHSEPVTCICTNRDSLFTCSEDKSVAKFDVHSLAFQSFVAKCPTPIRCMTLQPQQSGQRGQEQRQLLALGAEDLVIRIINTGTGIATQLPGLKHPPSSLAFHPDGKSLFALTVQGSVALLDPTGAKSPRYSNLVARSCRIDQGEDCCHIAFHPLGKFVAVPAAKPGDILLVGSSELQLVKTLSGVHVRDVTACAWSPNGQFLATTSKDKLLVIWRVGDWAQCVSIQQEAIVTSLAWSPIQNMLALTNEDGSLVIFDDILTQAHGFQQAEWSYIHYITTEKDLELKPKPITASPFSQAPSYLTKHNSTLGVSEPGPTPALVPIQASPDKLQTRFQPAAIQVKGSSQLLAYNAYGVLKASFLSGQNSYSFASHDGRISYSFEEDAEFSLGALDLQGILLAKPATNFDAAMIYYRHHFDDVEAFRADLPKGEDVRTITTTPHGPVITTSLGYVRYFSCSGIQLGVTMGPSPTPVSLVSDMKDVIFHAFHFAHETGRLRLGYQLYSLRSKSVLGQGDLALAPNSTLTWIGFTSEGLPALTESNGLAQVLVDPFAPSHANWRPVARFEPNHHPYAMSKGELHCLQKDGTIVSNPTSSTIPWNIEPVTTLFNHPETEAKYLISRLFADMENEETMDPDELQQRHLIEDRLLLQLLLKACQADRPEQAVETILCLNRPQSLDYAHEIALRSKHLDVVRRIHDIRREKAKQTPNY